MLREAKRMGKINMENCEVCKCASLFKNVFRIRSTPEKELIPKPKTRRLVGMAARRIVSLDTITPSTDKENGTINRKIITSPQKTTVNKKSRFPLEDCDSNNQDKEYGSTNLRERDNRTGFQFAEPLGVAPRRMSVDQRSPMQSPIRSSPHGLVTDPMIFRSLSSGYESMDDDLNDLMDLDALDEATHLPNGLTSLLSGSIVGSEIMEYAIITTPEYPRTKVKRSFRRSLSLQNDRTNSQSSISKVRSCLFRSPSTTCSTRKLSFDENVQSRTPSYSSIMDSSMSNQSTRSCKRSEPPASLSPRLIKRSRISVDFQHIPENVELEISSNKKASYVTDIETKLVKKSHKSNLSIKDITDEVDFCNVSMKESFDDKFEDSQAHALIKSAIHRSVTDADLTGDFSKPCILPLAEGRHDDLKSISVDTLAALMRGDFKQHIDSFVIVDCRYPYEFDGGHIEGALNLYNKELIEQHLLDPLSTNVPEIQPNSIKRRILVFHCEFSWERGPNLSRFLRNIDRQRNKEHYPALHYPEVYLLHGGYEQFYKEQRNLCIPQGYKPMSDPNHEADLKQFRVKSKSWQGEKPVSRLNGLVVRTNIKRLGF